MGCSVPSGFLTTMSWLRRSPDEENSKAKLQQKLYIAKETPEPIFDLSECQLRHVPGGIYSICKVFRKEQLILNNNALKSLEDGGSLSDLYLLKILNISYNMFTKIDNDIKYLINLHELYVQYNELSYLPDGIGCLESLRILDVSQNQLKSIPASIGNLKKLRILILKENLPLTRLCAELCGASNLITIELDSTQFQYPPVDICNSGTIEIMKFLCKDMNIDYKPPTIEDEADAPIELSPSYLKNPFTKQPSFSWEEQEHSMMAQEKKIHEAAKQQRQEFLSQVLQDQSQLDSELAKLQIEKDLERQKFVKAIQLEEKEVASLVDGLIHSASLNPEIIQQQLEYEQAEHDRLLNTCREHYHNLRRADILKAMESCLDEEYAYQLSVKNYSEHLGDMKQSLLLQDMETSEKLAEVLKAKDESHSQLVTQLLEDQDIQKAMVSSLLERVDARSWSLNQEISIITFNLARLSMIEQEKKKLQVNYNYMQLLEQRVKLLELLDDLLVQQNKRRAQLIETLKEMENETQSTDFWLINYQRIMNWAPKSIIEMEKKLDPLLANFLLQEGVIHCLPFLVKFIFSSVPLTDITLENLKDVGVSLSADREKMLKAIGDYIALKKSEQYVNCTTEKSDRTKELPPSVTVLENDEEITGVLDSNVNQASSECVICMDARCEVVFVPCGHMCCCAVCAERDVSCCPMCRESIEKKIKVMIP